MNKCPICDANAGKVSFPYFNNWNGKYFEYHRCVKCITTFICPVPDEADFLEMYSKSVYHDIHYNNIELAAAKKSISRFLPHVVSGSSLLDFGCGNGNFLLAAKNAGFLCTGVEYEIAARQSASKASGCPVYSLDQLIKQNEKFDLIHIGDVLEHLEEPFLVMSKLNCLLKPGGRFLIEGPLEANPSVVFWATVLFALIKKLLGIYNGVQMPPTHLFMTNANAQLSFFTNRLGYTCIEYQTYETGWPYLTKEPLNVLNFFSLFKAIVGYSAIILSRIIPALSNRFAGVFKP